MKVNIKDFIEQSDLGEAFYPGKRVVKLCPQPGDYKSHCVVYDWRNPDEIRIEVKAGLTGKDLVQNDLHKYPVSFQAPTYMVIDVSSGELRTLSAEDAANDDEEGEEGSKGKSGGGGKRPAKKKSLSMLSFASAVEGALPELGLVTEMVVMGMKIAEEAFDKVATKLLVQVGHAKIAATDLIAAAGKLVTKFTPPAFLKPKGDENKVYKYNREKNEVMFSGMVPG